MLVGKDERHHGVRDTEQRHHVPLQALGGMHRTQGHTVGDGNVLAPGSLTQLGDDPRQPCRRGVPRDRLGDLLEMHLASYVKTVTYLVRPFYQGSGTRHSTIEKTRMREKEANTADDMSYRVGTDTANPGP